VPSFLTASLLVLAGFCLFAAVYFFTFYWLMVQKAHDRLAFSLVALFGAGFAYAIAVIMNAPDPETFRQGLLLYLGVFMPDFLCVLWFVGYYTGYRPRYFLWGMTVLTVIFCVVHWMRPFGILTDGLQTFSSSALPWGERIPYVRLLPSVWVFPWYLYFFIGLVYCAISGWKYVRSSAGKAGKGFLFCIAISFVAGGNNLLVDMGLRPGPYLSEMAILAFIIFMTLDLAREWRSQEAFFGEVFDAQNDALFIHDAETGQVLQVNKAAHKMYGARPGELLQVPPDRTSAPEPAYSPERALGILRKTLEEGSQVFEWHARRMDGSLFWVEVSLREATLSGRKRVVAVIRDISERRRNEEAIRESERRFSNIVRSSPVGMQFFHVDAENRLTFVGANPAMEKVVGSDFSFWEQLFPGTRGEDFVTRCRHTAHTGEPWRIECSNVVDGNLQGVYEVFVAQTEPGSVVVMYLDVTERWKMEEERLRVEIRMQEAQRLESLGMMAGGVAHDFNNILMAVKGNVETLAHNRKTSDETEVFTDIDNAVRRAAELCHQLLAFAGRHRLMPEALDLAQVVQETAKVVKVAGTTKARLDLRLGEKVSRVMGDATQLRQVVLNLMMNAVESLGEKGGLVTVLLGEERVLNPMEGLSPGLYVCLEVRDNGCGMSPETLERIFEPFFTTKFTGRGLGLAAVQGILKSHSGWIRVHSHLGEGTTMTVMLPASTGKGTMVTTATNNKLERFSGKALLVDDEADVRRVTRRMLERLGVQVVEAGDGKDGLEVFKREGDSFVGVLLDLTMPDMDGLETYGRLLDIRPGLPALLISGYGIEEMKDRLREYPCMMLVQKPFGREELVKGLSDIGWPHATDKTDTANT
jgi:two-component system cell cycle sensor histidine kinase/response regulator CckA